MAKILIVDDDKDILKFTDALLSQSGHYVKVATEPIMAMEFLNARSFDLIITDANMPHYTGFELVTTLRADDRFNDLGIAMLTGMREKESIEKAIKAGVDDYIVKPIEPMTFLRKVEDLLAKKPPQKAIEIQYSEISKETDAKIQLETKIISVSENGIKVLTNYNLPEGSLLTLQTSFFHRIGIEPPPLKVGSSTKQEKEYLVTVNYVGISEVDFQKIRSWVYHEANKKKYRVS